MIKVLIFIFVSSIFCLSQNIQDELFLKQDNDRVFTTFLLDENNSVSLFNWYFLNSLIYYKYFSYINIDNELNIKMINDTNFIVENYSDVIIKNNRYYIADNEVSTGETRLLEFNGENVKVIDEISENIKFKNSFFHNNLMFSTVNDAIYKDPDSLNVKFYISDLSGNIQDSVIYRGLKRLPGPNFYFRHKKPFRENGNTYILGAKGDSYNREFNCYLIKFNGENKIEFFKELQKQKDSLVPTGTSIIKYFDKYLIVGFEEDRKKSINYTFIKVLNSDFIEVNHFRYYLYPECYFNEVIVNGDSTLSVYGKRRSSKITDKFKPLAVKINKNFEIENHKVYYQDRQDNDIGFHYAVQRDNFDIVVGFYDDSLYIAKISKSTLNVENEIQSLKATYDNRDNTLNFQNEIPTSIEVFDLLGKKYYETEVKNRHIILPDLPNNQAIFVKIIYKQNSILQRIK